MKREKILRDSVVSEIVINVLIVIASESVYSVTVRFVNVSFVTVCIVIVNSVRTKALRLSSTTLTLSESLNTPLSFFCPISPSESLNPILYLSESVIDFGNEDVIFCFLDGSFPSSRLSFLKKAVPNLKCRGAQFLNVFLLLSDVFLLSVNVNENVIDGYFSVFDLA